MSKRDYYEVLGVEKSADERALKRAYRDAAKKYHPDRNPDNPEAEAKFKEAAEAYAVLSDAEKRATYDRFGHAGLEGRGGMGGFSAADIFSNFQDIFGDFFGGAGQRRRGPARGRHIETSVTLSLAETMTGCEREIELKHPQPCGACNATGAKNGELVDCETCGGVGRVARRNGGFVIQTVCPTCGGVGQMAKEICDVCDGQGQVNVSRRVQVTIPAGIDEGQQLRVGGKGQAGRGGGPPGDLYVSVVIEAEEGYAREGYDLYYDLRVEYPQAVLGAEVEVPNLVDGKDPITITIPAGIQPGDPVVTEGAGIPRLDGRGFGDLICVVNVRVPTKPSKKARGLIKELMSEL